MSGLGDAQIRQARKARRAFDDLVEDIEWLLDSRAPAEEVVRRVGYRHNPASLTRRLQRYGRHDLVARLGLNSHKDRVAA